MKFWQNLKDFLKRIFARPGFQVFIDSYLDTAREILIELARVNDGREFHLWKDQAWQRVKDATGQIRGNWIEILISIAFEELKARRKL